MKAAAHSSLHHVTWKQPIPSSHAQYCNPDHDSALTAAPRPQRLDGQRYITGSHCEEEEKKEEEEEEELSPLHFRLIDGNMISGAEDEERGERAVTLSGSADVTQTKRAGGGSITLLQRTSSDWWRRRRRKSERERELSPC